jgi:hypothetical protein
MNSRPSIRTVAPVAVDRGRAKAVKVAPVAVVKVPVAVARVPVVAASRHLELSRLRPRTVERSRRCAPLGGIRPSSRSARLITTPSKKSRPSVRSPFTAFWFANHRSCGRFILYLRESEICADEIHTHAIVNNAALSKENKLAELKRFATANATSPYAATAQKRIQELQP